ncbi:MAG: gamma-glutamylcyclotransferase [Acholeplasmatales bacterium]|jgi:gamma-glutamylcyclotransferase (GGCT)/AIG2-like uncharacterized protein YtfP|nr:gamma-glutamylcyclotransferase [Acholeplasmatales bacterium]
MKIFVYGTLKRNGSNNEVLQKSNARYLGDCLVNNFACVDTPLFPFLVKKKHHHILGEVFELDDKYLSLLDEAEGYPQRHNRTTIETVYGRAFIYYLKKEDHQISHKCGYVESWLE